MTKNEFLVIVNGIDDKYLNELIEIPQRSRIIRLSENRAPLFRRIALSAAAVICVFAIGITAAVKLRAPVTSSPNDSTSGGAYLSNVSESSLPITGTIPKIKRVADEGDDFEFRIGNDTTERIFSERVLKNDAENCAVFFMNCRGVSEENPLKIMVYATGKKGENVKDCRVCFLTVTKDGENFYTVPYEYYGAEYGEECYFQVIVKGEAYMGGKWLP